MHNHMCSPPVCLSTPYFSCYISPPYCSLEGRGSEWFLQLISTLGDTSFVAVIRTHNSASGVCCWMCARICVYVASEAKLAVIKLDLWQPCCLPCWRSLECPAVINTGFVWLCVCYRAIYLSPWCVHVKHVLQQKSKLNHFFPGQITAWCHFASNRGESLFLGDLKISGMEGENLNLSVLDSHKCGLGVYCSSIDWEVVGFSSRVLPKTKKMWPIMFLLGTREPELDFGNRSPNDLQIVAPMLFTANTEGGQITHLLECDNQWVAVPVRHGKYKP